MEDALTELLRNARDAGARNVYVASVLRRRRYRTLNVIDDGHGIPERYAALIFEPGVTTRHLDPTTDHPSGPAHGAGLSLYHIKNLALNTRVYSHSNPTAISATFDTRTLPERSLQSGSRPSRTNLLAAARNFITTARPAPPSVYYASPATILATLQYNHIIQTSSAKELEEEAVRLGLEVSSRTVYRVYGGEVGPAEPLRGGGRRLGGAGRAAGGGPVLRLTEDQTSRIADILRRAAAASYLEIGALRVRSVPGELSLKVSVDESEEEYE